MKSRNQTGSAHIVIIIILVVALVGALGFVFWQNFLNKPSSTRDTTNSATKSSLDMTFLEIDQFGVKIPYDRTSDTYTVEVFPANLASVQSKKANDACGRAVTIAYISHYKVDEKLPADYPGNNGKAKLYVEDLNNLPSVTIGDDFYSIQSLQYLECADPMTKDGAAINTILVDATNSFQAVFKNLQDN